MHLAADAFENVRHAVLSDQDGGAPGRLSFIEQRTDVVWFRSKSRRGGLQSQRRSSEVAGDLDRFHHHRE